MRMHVMIYHSDAYMEKRFIEDDIKEVVTQVLKVPLGDLSAGIQRTLIELTTEPNAIRVYCKSDPQERVHDLTNYSPIGAFRTSPPVSPEDWEMLISEFERKRRCYIEEEQRRQSENLEQRIDHLKALNNLETTLQSRSRRPDFTYRGDYYPLADPARRDHAEQLSRRLSAKWDEHIAARIRHTKALQERAKARLKTQKTNWINSQGSDHLREAYAAGYDCQRLYVRERADLERMMREPTR